MRVCVCLCEKETESRHQKGTSSITVCHVDKQLQNVSVNVTVCVCVCVCKHVCKTERVWLQSSYLYNIENHILIETVEDALGDTVVAPRPMDQKKLL